MAKQAQSAPAVSTAGNGSNGPVHTIRHRNIKAAIWENPTQNGPMYNVTVTRGYKDEAGQWHDSQSFGYDDLLVVAKLMYDAHSAITAAWAKERSGQADKSPRSSR
jgi:hypothetical protein